MARIERSERMGWILLGVSAVIAIGTLAFAKRRKPSASASVWLGSLLIAHPGWWMSARGGDCGVTRSMTSIGATVLMAIVAIVVVVRALRNQQAR